MLKISANINIPPDEIEIKTIRAQGAGGQNVNKLSTAVHLRFDVKASSLPQWVKDNLLASRDQRLSKDGIIIIKAQEFRSLEKNKIAAIHRLRKFVQGALVRTKKRKVTKPTKSSIIRRVDNKVKRGLVKKSRGKVDY